MLLCNQRNAELQTRQIINIETSFGGNMQAVTNQIQGIPGERDVLDQGTRFTDEEHNTLKKAGSPSPQLETATGFFAGAGGFDTPNPRNNHSHHR